MRGEHWLPATREDLLSLRRQIDMALGCFLSRLPDDIIFKIVMHMEDVHDRNAFAIALEPIPYRRVYCGNWLGMTYMVDCAVINAKTAIQALADKLFFICPSCFSLHALVMVDWSVFTPVRRLHRATEACACIYWSSSPPHANVIEDNMILRLHVIDSLAKGKPIMHFAAYNQIEPNTVSYNSIKLHMSNGTVTRVCSTPLTTLTFDLLHGIDENAARRFRARGPRDLVQSWPLTETIAFHGQD